jgi:hypothetical protein
MMQFAAPVKLHFNNICPLFFRKSSVSDPSSVDTTERAEAMKMLFARFTLDETGATAIEWGLVAVGILVAIISVVWLR